MLQVDRWSVYRVYTIRHFSIRAAPLSSRTHPTHTSGPPFHSACSGRQTLHGAFSKGVGELFGWRLLKSVFNTSHQRVRTDLVTIFHPVILSRIIHHYKETQGADRERGRTPSPSGIWDTNLSLHTNFDGAARAKKNVNFRSKALKWHFWLFLF